MNNYSDLYYFGKTYAEHDLYNKTVAGFLENKSTIESLKNTVVRRFDSGIEVFKNTIDENRISLLNELRYSIEKVDSSIEKGFNKLGDILNNCTDDIVDSIDNLRYSLGYDLSNIKWAIETQTTYTKNILNVLLNSLDNESKQLFQQGVKSYKVDELKIARNRFNLSLERNTSNYFAYQYLGFISVKENKEKDAEHYFNLAVKFAESEFHKALALNNLARHFYTVDNIAQALSCIENATKVYPSSAEFWYKRSLYSLLNNRIEDALTSLKEAINLNWNLWTIVLVDPEFVSIQDEILSMFEGIRNQKEYIAGIKLNQLDDILNSAKFAGCESGLDTFIHEFQELKKKFDKSNIFVFLEVIDNAEKSKIRVTNFIETKIGSYIEVTKSEITKYNKLIENAQRNYSQKIIDIDRQYINNSSKLLPVGKNYGYILIPGLWVSFFIISLILTFAYALLFAKKSKPETLAIISVGISTFITGIVYLRLTLKQFSSRKKNQKYVSQLKEWFQTTRISADYEFNTKIDNLQKEKAHLINILGKQNNALSIIKSGGNLKENLIRAVNI